MERNHTTNPPSEQDGLGKMAEGANFVIAFAEKEHPNDREARDAYIWQTLEERGTLPPLQRRLMQNAIRAFDDDPAHRARLMARLPA